MYAGRIVETGTTQQILTSPRHPYAQGLLASLPGLGGQTGSLAAIPGGVPDPAHLPTGCRFRDRCRHRIERCAREDPPEESLEPGHRVRCFVAPEPGGS